MNDAAGRFARRVLWRQALAGLVSFLVIVLLAPRLLLLDEGVAESVVTQVALVASASLATTFAFSFARLHKHRFVLRALALGSKAVEPDDLGGLAELPYALTLRFFLPHALASALLALPVLRPAMLDESRAMSLVVLAVTLLGAAALPHYVLTRSATNRLLEIAPSETVSVLLDAEQRTKRPRLRMTRRVLLAVAAPVAFVGVGTVLVTHAHLRAFLESSGGATALLVAQIGLEPTPGALREDGRARVVEQVRPLGYQVWLDREQTHDGPFVVRERDGGLLAVTPVDDGRGLVRFSASLDPSVVAPGIALALIAVLLAAWLGGRLGRGIAEDLANATMRVRLLSTESVLRGATQISRPARFSEVGELGRAIEVLAERFRVFAEAHEQALSARARAQRMRGLLFASVSHDLKSPLNAVLGFAELLAAENLGPSQRESLSLITTRGRELLALIETILDAARVDSGQLTLSFQPVDPGVLLDLAVRKARELTGDETAPIVVEVPDGLPLLPADFQYLPQAIAVIIAHALRTAASDPRARAVRVRASLPTGPDKVVRVDVEHGSRLLATDELEALLSRQGSSRGRGLTLGLSLARSVVELHGGTVSVDSSSDGVPVARCDLTLSAPRPGRRRLSAYPTLG